MGSSDEMSEPDVKRMQHNKNKRDVNERKEDISLGNFEETRR